jgi:hypothetical protein
MTRLALLLLILLCIGGCGGGGGGGGGGGLPLTGTVLLIGTGAPPNVQFSVTASGKSTLTNLADGTFSLAVSKGTTSLVLSATGFPSFTYTFPPVSSATNLGFLFVGPQQVALKGTVVDASNQQPVAGVTIDVLGRQGTSLADGTFRIEGLAYDPNGLVSVVFSLSKTGYIPRDVPITQPAIGGEIDEQNVLFAPESSTDPPPGPSNLYGFVTETGVGGGGGNGVLVTLKKKSDGTIVSSFVTGLLAGAANEYAFWVPIDQYSMEFEKPTGTLRKTVDANVTSLDTPLRIDVVLP